ncbi:hypothetical protein SteCoe_36012 [Stentor coeruleus]|uniref:Uncharacterized protein n=1 Tax=Stentor coeruleus TaxID=5963 RepID=A0A1R2AR40_9CILI|nr:hypothetical protein SteCoe_36012 [Stentor coeruleus]
MKVINSNYDRHHEFYTSESFINILFDNLNTGNYHSAKTKMRVLYSMLIKSSQRRDSNYFAALTEAIPQFSSILEVQSLRFSDTFMVLLEIIKLLILANNDEINKKIIDLKILDRIQTLVEKNPFCTILHNLYMGIIKNILTTNGSLSFYILNTMRISDFIVEKATNPLILMKKTKVRIGYIPHLLSIANLMLKLKEQDIRVEYTLENTPGWLEFVKDILEYQNSIENKELGICKTDIYEDSHSETDLLSEEDLKDFEDIDTKGEEKNKSTQKNRHSKYQISENNEKIDAKDAKDFEDIDTKGDEKNKSTQKKRHSKCQISEKNEKIDAKDFEDIDTKEEEKNKSTQKKRHSKCQISENNEKIDAKDFEDINTKGEEKNKSTQKKRHRKCQISENNEEIDAKDETSKNCSENVMEKSQETKEKDFVEINLELNTETADFLETHEVEENSETVILLNEEPQTLKTSSEKNTFVDENLLANYCETELLLMLVKESLDEYANFNQVNYWKVSVNIDELEDL